MSDTTLLKNPKKSHRKRITLPRYSRQLAEFFGIMMGDGGINNPWQANITLNAIKDAQYSGYIASMCKKLFGISPAIRKRKDRNVLVVSLTSTEVVDFLVKHGLVRGNKIKGGIQIPRWILARPAYRKACVRGLVDTDGCIFVHAHVVAGRSYRNIGLCFTSYAPLLILQVAEIMDEFGIMPHISMRGKEVYVYQAEMIARYLKVIGSSNSRIASVYNTWRGARAVEWATLER